jgi:transposase-like protein
VAISTWLNDNLKKTYPKHSPAFKTKVVLEALKERQTMSELAQR